MDREEMRARLVARRERDGETDDAGFGGVGGVFAWIARAGLWVWPSKDGGIVVCEATDVTVEPASRIVRKGAVG